MSDPAKAVRAKILTVSDITDVVGTSGVYYDVLPQTASLPAILVQMTDTDRMRALDAAQDFYRSVVEINVYAASHTDAVTVGDLIETNLEFGTGTWGTVAVSRAMVDSVVDVVESPDDGSDAWRRIRILQLIVWHS